MGKSGWGRTDDDNSLNTGWAREDDSLALFDEPPFDVKNLRARTDQPSVLRAVRLTSLLFARPESTLVKEQILQQLPYFDMESGKDSDFYCVGYRLASAGEPALVEVGHKQWAFSLETFVERKNQLEKITKWRYSGGADIVICNEVCDVAKSTKWTLDVATAVCINLDALIAEHIIVNFETFFQGVVRFAGNGKTSSDLSNGQIPALSAEAIRNGILSFAPEWLREPLKKAERFVVRDIRKG